MSETSWLTGYLNQAAQAAEGWRRVGWAGGRYVPEEILYAARLLPERMRTDTTQTMQADLHLQTSLCHYARGGFDQAMRGEWPVDGMVFAHSCDVITKLFHVWQRNAGTRNCFHLDVPHVNRPINVAYWVNELRRLAAWLEASFGTRVTDAALSGAIREYNTGRRLLQDLYALRQADPPLLRGSEALELTWAAFRTPRADYNRILAEALIELRRRSGQMPPRAGPRLLLGCGPLLNLELVSTLEQLGAVVVADDLATGYRYSCNLVAETGDPWAALAESYLAPPNSAYIHEVGGQPRSALIKELCRKYQVDGVVLYTLQYCDPYMHEIPLIEEDLRQDGTHVLAIEWAPVGRDEQLQNRLEAFLETIQTGG